MYLTEREFADRLVGLSSLTGGEHKKQLVQRALAQAHAALDAELAKRYALPIDLNAVPSHTRELLARWTFYLAVRELLGLLGISVSREEQPILQDAFELVDAQIALYTTGSALLDGVPAKSRVRYGYGEATE